MSTELGCSVGAQVPLSELEVFPKRDKAVGKFFPWNFLISSSHFHLLGTNSIKTSVLHVILRNFKIVTKILAVRDSKSINNSRGCFKISKILLFKGIKTGKMLNKVFTQVLESYHRCNRKSMGTIFLPIFTFELRFIHL